jgi:peptidoglycan glycosyltransferase
VNKQIRQLAAGLIALYIVLFATLNYWQVERKEDLDARFDNDRRITREFNRPRGEIVTADGVVVAESQPNPPGSENKYQRRYPTGELFANVTGYLTKGFGATGLEKTEGDVLVGTTAAQQVLGLADLVTGETDASGTVVLTMRSDLQQVAREALGSRQGSVVLLDPNTGALQAMWSYPSFDPNLIATPDFEQAGNVLELLQQTPGNPLRPRAYQDRFMPGSTFKVLTTSIGLEDGTIDLQSSWPDESQWVPPQTDNPIENYAGTVCGGDLREVFSRSCNIPFAKTAVELGPDTMVDGVARWGVGEQIPIDLPYPPAEVASTFGPTANLDQNLPLLAIRGFGQESVQMVPLHMAMVAATVANEGRMMKPYVVDERLDHSGRVLDRTEPEVWKEPITASTAETLTELMELVATEGTASCCIALEGGIPVAAKTGTAQLNEEGEPEESHAWTIAFAPADDPQYAVAVIIEGTDAEISASTGGQLAGPVAKTVLDAALAGG